MDLYRNTKSLISFFKRLPSDINVDSDDSNNFKKLISKVISESSFENKGFTDGLEGPGFEVDIETNTMNHGNNIYWKVSDNLVHSIFPGFGWFNTDGFFDNYLSQGEAVEGEEFSFKLLKSKVKLKGMWVYAADSDVGVSGDKPIRLILKLKGREVFNKEFQLASIEPIWSDKYSFANGYLKISVATYYSGFCDEVILKLTDTHRYLAVDQISYVK